MAQRVDRPYWFNWLRWHLVDRHRKDMPVQRRAIWHFFNYVETLEKGSLVIDCGANVGNVTAAFVRRGFYVHAFEPDPYARRFLEKRFGKHPLVTIHPRAVGVLAGSTTLYRIDAFAQRPKKASMSSSVVRRTGHTDVDAIEVEVVDLSEFMRSLGRRVDLLKLDVEGSEVAIVEKLLDEGTYRDVGMVYAETHERHSADLAERTANLRRRIAEAGITNINLDWR